MERRKSTSADPCGAYSKERDEMVERQIAARGIRQERVLQAMRLVSRHLFVEERMQERAHNDSPLPIAEGQTISQPYIVALMTEALSLTGKEKVLEIGSGSGYQAAILSHLAAKVFSIERFPLLAQAAKEKMEKLQMTNVEIITGDGTRGLPLMAPFDAIIVTAAAKRVPTALLKQLREGGVLVVPVDYDSTPSFFNDGDADVQKLLKVRLLNAQTLQTVSENLCDCRFVRLIGEH